MRDLAKYGRLPIKDFLKRFPTKDDLAILGTAIELGWLSPTIQNGVPDGAEKFQEFCWVNTLHKWRSSDDDYFFLKSDGLAHLITIEDRRRGHLIAILSAVASAIIINLVFQYFGGG